MPALAETKQAVNHVRRLNSLRFILGAAALRNGRIFFSERWLSIR